MYLSEAVNDILLRVIEQRRDRNSASHVSKDSGLPDPPSALPSTSEPLPPRGRSDQPHFPNGTDAALRGEMTCQKS